MTTIQRSKAHIILLACSLVGAGIAIYLTAVHYENVPLVCSDQGLVNCSYVLSSAYSVVPGTSVPISVPGLAWCLVSGALAIAGLYSARLGRQRRLVAFLTAGAGLLVGLQSIGQLTLRDVIVVLLLAVILYAYLTYAKKRPVR